MCKYNASQNVLKYTTQIRFEGSEPLNVLCWSHGPCLPSCHLGSERWLRRGTECRIKMATRWKRSIALHLSLTLFLYGMLSFSHPLLLQPTLIYSSPTPLSNTLSSLSRLPVNSAGLDLLLVNIALSVCCLTSLSLWLSCFISSPPLLSSPSCLSVRSFVFNELICIFFCTAYLAVFYTTWNLKRPLTSASSALGVVYTLQT